MSNQVLIAEVIEGVFVAASFALLSISGAKAFYRWAGTVLLCLTFCWSVILGCVLALNGLTFTL